MTRLHRPRVRTRSRATVLLAMVVATVVTAAALLAVSAWHTLRNSTGGTLVTFGGPPVQLLPRTPGSLLVTVGADNKVAGLTVFAEDPSGHGGTVIVIPVASRVDAIAGPARIGSLFDSGGLEAETNAVASLLGVDLAGSVAVDQAALSTFLTPMAPITVSPTDAVLNSDANGNVEETWKAGTFALSAPDAARYAMARVDSQSEMLRLGRLVQFWNAVALRRIASAASSNAKFDAVAQAVLGGTATAVVLAVSSGFDPLASPADEQFVIDAAGVQVLVAQVLPGAVSVANTNLRVRIVNPFADPSVARAAVAKLTFLRSNVVLLTSSTNPPPTATLLEFASDTAGQARDQKEYEKVFGPVTIAAAKERVEQIDVTVTLGADFKSLVDSEAAAQATSTTSPANSSSTIAGATTTKTTSKG